MTNRKEKGGKKEGEGAEREEGKKGKNFIIHYPK